MTAATGFQEQKRFVQLRFMRQQAEQLASPRLFNQLIKKTYEDAPLRRISKRRSPQDLIRNSAGIEALNKGKSKRLFNEKHFERACYEAWNQTVKWDQPDSASNPFERIVSYQWLTKDTNADKGWGEIDMLGATKGGHLVVIEAKTEPSQKFIAAIMEAAAYAIAVRKNFADPKSHLSVAWAGNGLTIPGQDTPIPMVVMAPASYWETVTCQETRRRPNQTPKDAWPAIRAFIDLLEGSGYPLRCVSVRVGKVDAGNSMPKISKATCQRLPT